MYVEDDGLGTKVEILIALLDNGPMNRSALTKIINYDSAVKILRCLQSAGLTDSQ